MRNLLPETNLKIPMPDCKPPKEDKTINIENGNDDYYEDINFMNINPPTWPHDDVEIIGNKRSLTLLKEAIEKCLETNQDVNVETFDTNGEGFNLTVKLRDMSKQPKDYEYNLED
jgi:hypothetical protein